MGRLALFLPKCSPASRNSGDRSRYRGGRMVRTTLHKHKRNAAKLKKRPTQMPEVTETDQLQSIRDLLREGRVNEADKQINDLQEKIRQEAERKKREMPPPA